MAAGPCASSRFKDREQKTLEFGDVRFRVHWERKDEKLNPRGGLEGSGDGEDRLQRSGFKINSLLALVAGGRRLHSEAIRALELEGASWEEEKKTGAWILGVAFGKEIQIRGEVNLEAILSFSFRPFGNLQIQ